MAPQVEITPEHALHLVRSRMHPKIPLEDSGIQTPSATRIVEGFRARFDKACDAGVWKRLSNAVLEPANPFDVSRQGKFTRLRCLVLDANKGQGDRLS